MNKRLLLMRHAEAETATIRTPDFDRKLTRRGLAQACEMAEALKQLDYLPNAILYSAALRTTQTAEQIANTLTGKPLLMISEKVLYNAPSERVIEAIRFAELPEDIHTLLVIAHNPGISRLAAECGWQDHMTAYFPPAGMAAFDITIQNRTGFSPQSCKWLFFKVPGKNL
ncbi:MAG TPA: histidine phosphatase family protein [Edaphocola sp.]|nr:histidine phosphatase family protein [Edaphocola sp.]